MQPKSFFEYLGMADMEKIHSQLLAWLFSKDCLAMSESQKNILLGQIFKLDNTESIIGSPQTERNGIDILIETQNSVLVIENKIKSSVHSNQLSKYEKYCEEKFKHKKPHYYYLTLISESLTNTKWERINYENIYHHLSTVELNIQENHSKFIEEYLIYLDRLTKVVKDFEANTSKYDFVFKDGKKKKEDKINVEYLDNNQEFVAKNQLETILQKCFLNKLANKMHEQIHFITDTRGDALINFHIKENIEFDGRYYTTFIQLQNNSIKFALCIQGAEYLNSKKEWIEKIIPIMEQLKNSNGYGYYNLNKPTKKAYVSISKKTDGCYWNKNIDELKEYLSLEIQNGKILTGQLISLI